MRTLLWAPARAGRQALALALFQRLARMEPVKLIDAFVEAGATPGRFFAAEPGSLFGAAR